MPAVLLNFPDSDIASKATAILGFVSTSFKFSRILMSSSFDTGTSISIDSALLFSPFLNRAFLSSSIATIPSVACLALPLCNFLTIFSLSSCLKFL